jgi:methionyl-tRNA formyltransferase
VRTVYLGSSAFAVEVLKALAASEHRPALVISPPDRPQGRGRRVAPPPVAVATRELGIDLLQTANVNEPAAIEEIARRDPEVICVCEFGQLIRQALLERYLLLNVHPSLVPRWRGAAPIERAIMAGDTETGVTIFRIEEGLDSGPIALAQREPIRPDDTYGTLAPRLAHLGGALLIEGLDQHERGALGFTEQDDEGVTYAPKLEPADRRLDPERPAEELARVVRALSPHVGSYVELPGGKRLGVTAARASEEPLQPGEMHTDDHRLLLGCAAGALDLLEVRPPGKRTMSAAEYLRGHRLHA